MRDHQETNDRQPRFEQPKSLTPFRLSGFRIWHLLVIMFSVACLVSLTRLSWDAARSDYTSIEFVLGTLGCIGFPIGIGMLNRGGFFTMVFSFAFALGIAAATFNLSLSGF